MTDDHQEFDPTEGAIPDHSHLDPDRVVMAWVKDGEPEWSFSRVKDLCMETQVVLGGNLPKWEIRQFPCPSGCHIETWLIDTANGGDDVVGSANGAIGYLLWASPNIQIAGQQMEIHPAYVQAEVTKRKAALN